MTEVQANSIIIVFNNDSLAFTRNVFGKIIPKTVYNEDTKCTAFYSGKSDSSLLQDIPAILNYFLPKVPNITFELTQARTLYISIDMNSLDFIDLIQG